MKQVLENQSLYPESTMTAQVPAVWKCAVIMQKLLTQVELAEIKQLDTSHMTLMRMRRTRGRREASRPGKR